MNRECNEVLWDIDNVRALPMPAQPIPRRRYSALKHPSETGEVLCPNRWNQPLFEH